MEPNRKTLTVDDLRLMRLPERYWTVTADGISAYVVAPGVPRTHMVDVVKAYASALPERFKDGAGLFFYGPNGRGKTSAAAVLAMEIRRQKFAVMFVESARLKTIALGKEQDSWDQVRDVQFLVIDDLGKGVSDGKGFAEELFDDLIRHRGARLLPTIITSNIPPNALVATEDGRSTLKKSTLAMMQETVAFFELAGDDLRRQARDDLPRKILGLA